MKKLIMVLMVLMIVLVIGFMGCDNGTSGDGDEKIVLWPDELIIDKQNGWSRFEKNSNSIIYELSINQGDQNLQRNSSMSLVNRSGGFNPSIISQKMFSLVSVSNHTIKVREYFVNGNTLTYGSTFTFSTNITFGNKTVEFIGSEIIPTGIWTF